jgi:hypothetical protein
MSRWPCGHPRHRTNRIVRISRGRPYWTCRACYNAYHRRYYRQHPKLWDRPR